MRPPARHVWPPVALSVGLALAGAGAVAHAGTPPLSRVCLRTLRAAVAGVLCDPGLRGSPRPAVLSARGYESDAVRRAARGRAGLRGARPLEPETVVRVRGRASRRAQLVLAYRLPSRVFYVRFARFGTGRDLGAARVIARRTGTGGLRVRLRVGHRRLAPVASYASLAELAGRAPPPPAPAPALVVPGGAQQVPTPSQWIRCRDGSLAMASPEDALDRRWAQEVRGWGGGDGALSAPLPDGRVVWLFGDSVLGTAGARPFVHNAMVVQSGETLATVGSGLSAALESGSPDRWYWPQAATVEQGELRAFFARYERVGAGPWGFRYLDSQLAQFSLPDLTVRHVTTRFPGSPVTWGAAILEDVDYTYIYGVEDRGLVKALHVARVPRGQLLGPWDVWTGLLGWGPGPVASTPIQEGISNQISVIGTGDGYLLITQEPLFGRRILALWAPKPTGPWSNPQVIYTTPDGPGVITYNAVAHPELVRDGQLLLSYSVNGTGGEGPFTVYAPRFVRVPVACLKGR